MQPARHRTRFGARYAHHRARVQASGNKAFEAQIALVASRVSLLEAASADPQLDDGEAAFVVADRRLSGDALDGYILNIKITGLVKSEDFELLEPVAKDELNKIESLRWYSILLAGSFTSDTAQLAKEQTEILRLSCTTVRITFVNPLALTKLMKFSPEFQKTHILRKLFHDLGRTMSLATDPKTTTKPKPKPSSKPKPYVQRVDIPPPPLPFHQHPSAWRRQPPAPYYPQSNNGFYHSSVY